MKEEEKDSMKVFVQRTNNIPYQDAQMEHTKHV